MGLRRTQLSLTFAALLGMMDLVMDVREVRRMSQRPDWTLPALIAILLGSGLTEAVKCVNWRLEPVRFILSLGRLNVFPDTYRMFARPNYKTLHPQFARPLPLWIQASTKAIPMLLLQVYSNLHLHPAAGHPSGDLEQPGLLLVLFKGCAATSFALAAYEVEDFKERQILVPIPYASWSFAMLMTYRLAELVARILLLLLLSVWDVRLLLAVVALDLAGLAALSNGRIQELGLYWHFAALFFVFWDNPISTTQRSGGHGGFHTLINPGRYFLLRAAESVAFGAALLGVTLTNVDPPAIAESASSEIDAFTAALQGGSAPAAGLVLQRTADTGLRWLRLAVDFCEEPEAVWAMSTAVAMLLLPIIMRTHWNTAKQLKRQRAAIIANWARGRISGSGDNVEAITKGTAASASGAVKRRPPPVTPRQRWPFPSPTTRGGSLAISASTSFQGAPLRLPAQMASPQRSLLRELKAELQTPMRRTAAAGVAESPRARALKTPAYTPAATLSAYSTTRLRKTGRRGQEQPTPAGAVHRGISPHRQGRLTSRRVNELSQSLLAQRSFRAFTTGPPSANASFNYANASFSQQ